MEVAADGRQTVLIAGNAEEPAVQIIDDVVNAVNENTSVLTVMNMTTDATVTAAYSNGGCAARQHHQRNFRSGRCSIRAIRASWSRQAGVRRGQRSGAQPAEWDLRRRLLQRRRVDGTSGAAVVELPPAVWRSGPAARPATR
ncbi:MAG: hypothetical protein U0521_09825 [Anaerolineae bacterium]